MFRSCTFPAAPALSQYSVKPNFSPVRTYASVSKFRGRLSPSRAKFPRVMRRAFHALRNGRPGPVIVEIPADVGTPGSFRGRP